MRWLGLISRTVKKRSQTAPGLGSHRITHTELTLQHAYNCNDDDSRSSGLPTSGALLMTPTVVGYAGCYVE